jgi:methionyl-tRNA formyltransferase
MQYKVLFLGRSNCIHTNRLIKILKNLSKVKFIKSNFPNEKINWKTVIKHKYDFIFCFRSYFILNKKVLESVKVASINFHPGTLKYRGFGGINFALLNNEKYFGCTAHLINKKIDNGPVIKQIRFNINKLENLDKILIKTHSELFNLAKYLITKILKNINIIQELVKANKKYKWSKKIYSKRELEKIYQIKKIKNKNYLKKIIFATYCEKFKPYILLDNQKFFLNKKNLD